MVPSGSGLFMWYSTWPSSRSEMRVFEIAGRRPYRTMRTSDARSFAWQKTLACSDSCLTPATDKGSQFTGSAFTSLLAGNGITISMDGKGAWRDQPPFRLAPG